MIGKNLWEKWWKHYIAFESQLKEIWVNRVTAGERKIWVDFLEEVRCNWFKEAKNNE